MEEIMPDGVSINSVVLIGGIGYLYAILTATAILGFLLDIFAVMADLTIPNKAFALSLFAFMGLRKIGLRFILAFGLIRVRRWGRTLILAYIWSWFISASINSLWLFSPSHLKELLGLIIPQGTPRLALLLGGTFSAIALAWPIILLLIFHSTNVSLTLKNSDHNPQWLDGFPIPVCVLLFWLVDHFIYGVERVVIWGQVLNFTEMAWLWSLGGLPVLALLAWSVYRRDTWAWWLLLGCCLLVLATSTLLRPGWPYPPDFLAICLKFLQNQLGQKIASPAGEIAKLIVPIQQSNTMEIAACSIYFGIILWMRKFFINQKV